MNKEIKICQNCKLEFAIEQEDFNFYEKLQVPAPTFCPECRLQRRLAWRNERTLYKRKCDLCQSEIIAMYPSETSFPIYCRSCWFSDKWDATEFGREYDFSQPFFSQFLDLLKVVPQIAIQIDRSLNCDYCNQIAECKNCYLLTSSSENEDCMFGFRILNSKNVLDGWAVIKCENCYECTQSLESAQMKFADLGMNSVDLQFVYDVRGSQDCFMSSNLRGKKYVFRNKSFSKEEYKKKISEIDTGSYSNLEKYKEEFRKLKLESLHKYNIEKQSVNSSGDSLAYTKNCQHCFFTSDAEDSKFCLLVNKAKDIYDTNNGCCGMEKIYEVSTTGLNVFNIKFSADIWPEAREVMYSQSCRNGASNLFGCVGIRKKQYCILNKEYSQEEYEALEAKIIQHMDQLPYFDSLGREYKFGEFFPIEISPFAYNESAARDFFPLTEEEARKLGYRWQEIERRQYRPTLLGEAIPDHIKDVDDNITNEVLECLHKGACDEFCTSAFKITASELSFYKKMNLPIPRLCFNCRHYQRFRSRNPLRLWQRRCMCKGILANGEEQIANSKGQNQYQNSVEHFHGSEPCPNEFETSYAPERPEMVYCEECYNAEIM